MVEKVLLQSAQCLLVVAVCGCEWSGERGVLGCLRESSILSGVVEYVFIILKINKLNMIYKVIITLFKHYRSPQSINE